LAQIGSHSRMHTGTSPRTVTAESIAALMLSGSLGQLTMFTFPFEPFAMISPRWSG
jgi:hypothetical protein